MPSAAELAGAKVKHTADELDEGETMILTLGENGQLCMARIKPCSLPLPRRVCPTVGCLRRALRLGPLPLLPRPCCAAALLAKEPRPFPRAAEDKGILDEKGNLVEEDDLVLENILAASLMPGCCRRPMPGLRFRCQALLLPSLLLPVLACRRLRCLAAGRAFAPTLAGMRHSEVRGERCAPSARPAPLCPPNLAPPRKFCHPGAAARGQGAR